MALVQEDEAGDVGVGRDDFCAGFNAGREVQYYRVVTGGWDPLRGRDVEGFESCLVRYLPVVLLII